MSDLIFVKTLANGLSRYRCTRLRNGQECGNVRDLRKHVARVYKSCAECAELSKHQARPRGLNVNALNFRKIRSTFSEQQLERYYDILKGRRDLESQRDAVEIVLIEGRLPDGICCRACLRKIQAA